MAGTSSDFQPNYAIPPGEILAEHLEAHGLSQAELARRCNRSPKLISEIVAGKAPIRSDTALDLEKVLGVDAKLWTNLEATYQLRCARLAEAEQAEAHAAWARQFPLRDMAGRGFISHPACTGDTVNELMAFFGVASIEAWEARYSGANVAYRHSPSVESDRAALATWLRLGERAAAEVACGDFDAHRVRQVLRELRGKTRGRFDTALAWARSALAEAGVALVTIKPLGKAPISGAAWWLTPHKAVIQLSIRYKTDDHFWFSLFHEAAHLLLHSKKDIFIEKNDAGGGTDIEDEANRWAADFLVPQKKLEAFAREGRFSAERVRAFAREIGVAPGIVVGQLQHKQVIPYKNLNGLKKKLQWGDD